MALSAGQQRRASARPQPPQTKARWRCRASNGDSTATHAVWSATAAEAHAEGVRKGSAIVDQSRWPHKCQGRRHTARGLVSRDTPHNAVSRLDHGRVTPRPRPCQALIVTPAVVAVPARRLRLLTGTKPALDEPASSLAVAASNALIIRGEPKAILPLCFSRSAIASM